MSRRSSSEYDGIRVTRARVRALTVGAVTPVPMREVLAPYAHPRVGRSVQDLLTAAVPYLALSVLMYASLSVSYLLTLALAIPAAGFLLRTYILFHDCTHGSFLPSKRANAWLGST